MGFTTEEKERRRLIRLRTERISNYRKLLEKRERELIERYAYLPLKKQTKKLLDIYLVNSQTPKICMENDIKAACDDFSYLKRELKRQYYSVNERTPSIYIYNYKILSFLKYLALQQKKDLRFKVFWEEKDINSKNNAKRTIEELAKNTDLDYIEGYLV